MASIWSNVDKSDDPQAAAGWQATMADWPFCRQYKRRTVEFMQLAPGDCVLDLGCESGADLIALRDRVGASGSVLGIDSSEHMVAYARERIVADNANIDLTVADAHALPFQTGMFDACRADRVFQHLRDPYIALQELVRVTKPAGRIVIVDPDQDTLVIAVDAGPITQTIRNFRREHPANPTISGRLGSMLAQLNATPTVIEGHTLVLRKPEDAFGLVEWPEMLQSQGKLSEEEISIWQSALQRTLKTVHFFIL